MGNVKGATVENSLAVPQMVKHRVNSVLRNSTPRYMSEEKWKTDPHQSLYMNVSMSIIYNNQKRRKKPNAHQLMNNQYYKILFRLL